MDHNSADSPQIGSLAMSDDCVHPATRVMSVVESFFESKQLDAVAAVEGREAVGLITRTKLLFSVFRRYGFELYGRKPVIVIAEPEPLYICERERLDDEDSLRKAVEQYSFYGVKDYICKGDPYDLRKKVASCLSEN